MVILVVNLPTLFFLKYTSPEWPTVKLDEEAAISDISTLPGGGTYVFGWVFLCFAVTPILLLPIGVGRPAEVFALLGSRGPFFFLLRTLLVDGRIPLSLSASILEAPLVGAISTSVLRTSRILGPTSSTLRLGTLRFALTACRAAYGFWSAWANKVSISLMTWLELSSGPYSQWNLI
jgi:hypothetical protein